MKKQISLIAFNVLYNFSRDNFYYKIFSALLKSNLAGDCGPGNSIDTLKFWQKMLNYIRPNIHIRHNTGTCTHTHRMVYTQFC